MKKKTKSLLSTFLKTGITIVLLYIVFTKIPFTQVWEILKNADLLLLTTSLICFILSQWVSADRLYFILSSSNFQLSSKSNYILYLIGMFYNFFIPGGVGGDAYKIYILNKEFRWSIKKLSAVIFIDRFMGLTALGILISVTGFVIPFFAEKKLTWIIFLTLVIGILSSYIFVKMLFSSFIKVFMKTIVQSIFIQLLQCVCILTLLASISATNNYAIYVFVFLISSVLSVFSFSGIGVREMIFFWASTLFVFDSTTAVTVGLMFSVLTAFVSLFGLVFHIKTPQNFIKKNVHVINQ